MSSAPVKILAVVVAFEPGADVESNLAAIYPQVGRLVVVDNGSTDVAFVTAAAKQHPLLFIRNTENKGVAAALNQAARIALEEGYDWLATFDQDSLVPPGAIAEMMTLLERHPRRESIAIIAMSHRDRGTSQDYHLRGDILEETQEWREVRTTITSGALVRVSTLRALGLFDETLFIDSVDLEFCLRCRKNNLLVIESCKTVLAHSIGSATEHKLLGRRLVCTNHSPLRRYYMTRNQLSVCCRYVLFDPFWALRGLYHLLGSNVAVLLYEDKKAAKMLAMITGLAHFVLGRYGRR